MSDAAWLAIYLTISVLAMALLLWLIITALVQIYRNTDLGSTARLLWFAGVIIAPALGAILWFGFGTRNASTIPSQK